MQLINWQTECKSLCCILVKKIEEIVLRRDHLNSDLEYHVTGEASDQKWEPLQWGQVWLGKKGEVETPWFREVKVKVLTGCLWTRWPKKGNYDQTKATENFLLRAPCFFYNSCRNNPISFCSNVPDSLSNILPTLVRSGQKWEWYGINTQHSVKRALLFLLQHQAPGREAS